MCCRSILQLIQPFEEEDRFCLVFEKMYGGMSTHTHTHPHTHTLTLTHSLTPRRPPAGPYTEEGEVCREGGSRGDKRSGCSSSLPPRQWSRPQRSQTTECSLSQATPGSIIYTSLTSIYTCALLLKVYFTNFCDTDCVCTGTSLDAQYVNA